MLRHVLPALIAFAALPVSAQTKPGDTVTTVNTADIVVTAQRAKERDQQVRDFVRGMTRVRGSDPLARFDAARVCPKAMGLGPALDEAITTRMRRVAAAAGLRLADKDCRDGNALVIFAQDKNVMIKLLREEYPWLFQNIHGEPIRVAKEEGAAAAWHVDGLVDRDGNALQRDGNGYLTTRTISSPTRLQAMVRPVFLTSAVVIERRGVEGLTTTQIADYAAMRVFADADPARAVASGAPSILGVLNVPMGGETPLSVSAWDLNYLRGLYAAPPNSYADAQKSEIGRTIKKGLDTPPSAAQR